MSALEAADVILVVSALICGWRIAQLVRNCPRTEYRCLWYERDPEFGIIGLSGQATSNFADVQAELEWKRARHFRGVLIEARQWSEEEWCRPWD